MKGHQEFQSWLYRGFTRALIGDRVNKVHLFWHPTPLAFNAAPVFCTSEHFQNMQGSSVYPYFAALLYARGQGWLPTLAVYHWQRLIAQWEREQ